MQVNWTQFKAFVTNHSVPYQEVNDDTGYDLEAYDGPVYRFCQLRDSADITDYETNWQAGADTPLTDPEGATLIRFKMAPSGWTFHAHAIEFETSVLNSLVNDKVDGTGWGDATLKFYDVNGTEITTQATADTDCVKTILEWEPLYDYEVVGGFLSAATAVIDNARCYIVAVPDIPAGSGGSKVMVNGINMKHIDASSRLTVDGRTSKRMNYNATYHTNKMQVTMNHDVGSKNKLMIVFEVYKA